MQAMETAGLFQLYIVELDITLKKYDKQG